MATDPFTYLLRDCRAILFTLGQIHLTVYTTKPEMDANATRAELEGGHVEDCGDGIYVWKPELEGTPGTERHRGAHVRKKSELENPVGNMHFCRATAPNESEAISGS
ncbi:hypothetical protein F5Y07DRAFT_377249 [Xylaria sp. FL0933]|nr:hypothetical protein F5Y07DRAFT_377249 [Xylaria sp. FL0933]